jgi:hypothetical protein
MFAARVISECACAGSTQFTTTRLCRKMGKRSKANQKTKDQVENRIERTRRKENDEDATDQEKYEAEGNSGVSKTVVDSYVK